MEVKDSLFKLETLVLTLYAVTHKSLYVGGMKKRKNGESWRDEERIMVRRDYEYRTLHFPN